MHDVIDIRTRRKILWPGLCHRNAHAHKNWADYAIVYDASGMDKDPRADRFGSMAELFKRLVNTT